MWFIVQTVRKSGRKTLFGGLIQPILLLLVLELLETEYVALKHLIVNLTDNMLDFLLGVFFGSGLMLWIFGLRIFLKGTKERIKEKIEPLPKGGSQFLDSVDLKKKWLSAETLKDILEE